MIERSKKSLEQAGRYFEFLGEVLRASFKKPFRLGLLLAEIETIGIKSIPIIVLAGSAIGMIFALQMVSILQPFQGEMGVGAGTAIAMGREFAPIITVLMLIAKNGSAMAAELGTMRVTEQIDALESMAVNPVQYLVVPRVFASLITFPALTMLANIVGVLGAYLISIYLYRIDSATYIDYMFNMLKPTDITTGLIKAALMGIIVSTVCCFYGLNSREGAKGVGDGATKGVVVSSVSILVADYLLATVIMNILRK